MEENINVEIEEYNVDQVKCKEDIITTYFKKRNSEYEILKIGFYNGTDEMNFFLNTIDNIADENCLKENGFKIAFIDSIPVALINPKTNDICIINFPFSDNLKSFIYNENIHKLQLKYKKTIEFFEEKIRETLDKLNLENERKFELKLKAYLNDTL